MRTDAPSGAAVPGGPATPGQPGEPQQPRKPTREVQEPVGGTPDDSTAIDQNAQTSQGEPSDDSGHE